ncbi:unnamed protein product [Tilletia laevis]|uniref:AMP-dependent synthetase/ligase domain-containing protein n=1 Tax=Tilletia laevis TaxID=157183 RepID=A0A9N8QIJ8_9BASI|nr:unnamed protein product [Tilletia laevis]
MRGNLAMLGYYNDPAATSTVVRGRSHAGSWFLTGDLAVRMPGGEVMILDRGKDIIISGGENISSLNIETELATHPENSTGKILKAELRKRLLADAGSVAGASGSAGTKAKL